MKLIVTSPMRTGSTWIYEVLVAMLSPKVEGFVSTAEEALRLAAQAPVCVLKSHSLIDIDVERLRGNVHSIRVLRNYKDSLISRALYCRNVRRAEGERNEPAEDAIIDECYGLGDRSYVNAFLARCPCVANWMEEIVVYERGEFDFTFYYEMLLHNTRSEFLRWLQYVEADERLFSNMNAALAACSFRNVKQKKTRGFIGSTGVGQWLTMLDEPVSERLDEVYLEQKRIVASSERWRKPVSSPGSH